VHFPPSPPATVPQSLSLKTLFELASCRAIILVLDGRSFPRQTLLLFTVNRLSPSSYELVSTSLRCTFTFMTTRSKILSLDACLRRVPFFLGLLLPNTFSSGSPFSLTLEGRPKPGQLLMTMTPTTRNSLVPAWPSRGRPRF